VTPLAWTLDHVGPLARTVEDLALLLQALAGHDPADRTSARVAVPDYGAGLERPLRGTRVGVPRRFVSEVLDREVASVFETALRALAAAGAIVSEVDVPILPSSGPALGAAILSEASAGLRSLLGGRVAEVGAETRVYLELGKLVTAAHYHAAQRVRTVLYEQMLTALASVDVLATPATPLAAPGLADAAVELGGRTVGVVEAVCRFTGPFNLTGLPALVVPSGFTAAGLPVGLQLVGRPFGEGALLAAGHAWQRETDWHMRLAA
jgi:aspartyl-tRNA(Asn)/glutamyl-tRNA(Gln) amidotransferase subunit A